MARCHLVRQASVEDYALKILLALAAMVDLALAALLVGVSGFFFGGGPEGMHGAIGPAIGWWAMFIACLAAPAIGILLARRGRPGTGLLVACAPAVAAALVTLVPFHPY